MNVAQGGCRRVLRHCSGNMPKIHLNLCLCRLSYTTLKQSIARNPHSGHVEMSFLSLRLVLEDLRRLVAAGGLTLVALDLPLASEILNIEDSDTDVR